jgi:formyltetrahydrofolate deformylase
MLVGKKILLADTAILLVDCPDRRGIVAAIANFLYSHGANILHADQHQDNEAGTFFLRVEWSLDGFDLDRHALLREFEAVSRPFQMRWQMAYSADRLRVALFVSRYQHCIVDLLYRHHAGELKCEIPLIISNHPDAGPLAAFYGLPYYAMGMDQGKEAAEKRQLELLEENRIDLVILARYMQVLPPAFVERYPSNIINVHHSFLPAFTGARPYHAAFERGVKLIGATSHYVTGELDEGPIIDQDVIRISHRDQVVDLVQKGRDLERMVLSRAVRWRLDHRILVYGNKTVVFD